MEHPYGNRLIYAADPNFILGTSIPEMIKEADAELDKCCEALEGLGVTIKGNTLFRLLGASAFIRLEQAACGVFGDYKLFDVQSTCINDGSWLQNVPNLEILTVNARVHPQVFVELSKMLPGVIIAPVDPLTDLGDAEFQDLGFESREAAVRMFFDRVMKLRSNGAIASPKDLAMAPVGFHDERTVITAGIRPLYTFVVNDTNAVNAFTPTKAIEAGADRLVVGSPIRFEGQMRRNVIRILDEIGEALEP